MHFFQTEYFEWVWVYLLTIQTKVMNRKACSVIFKQLMYNDKNTLLCEAEVKVACIDGQMKPRRIPAPLF